MRNRAIFWFLFLLQLMAVGVVVRHFWPRAVEIEDVKLIRLLPGNHGDMHFTNATTLQLMDGLHEFGDVSAPNNDHALIYISPRRTSVTVNINKVELTGVGQAHVIGYHVPWWDRAIERAKRKLQ